MHTPGPWEISDADGEYLYVEHNDSELGTFTIAALSHAFSMARSKTVWEADARLIAAAPDLLAACEAALLRDDVADCELGEMLRAAISKARQS